MIIRDIKMIDSDDLDDLIQETYNKPYCFQQQDGCKSRGTHTITVSKEDYNEDDDDYPDNIPFLINGEEMGVKFKTWLNTTPEDINKNNPESYPKSYPGANNLFWERNFYPDIQHIVNDLCNKGLLEAGEYTINIDW